MPESCLLRLPLGEDCLETFNFEKAVCNHGFFMMSPNIWFPCTKTLKRPLRLANSVSSVIVSISHPPNTTSLLINVHGSDDHLQLSVDDRHAILAQVARMLRISDRDVKDIKEFHQIHSEAKQRCFGRIFRSPSLFEDAVKSILLCNCTWSRTLNMARALCNLHRELSNGSSCNIHLLLKSGTSERKEVKRKQPEAFAPTSVYKSNLKGDELSVIGNFPTARELASLSTKFLNERCNLGYRARTISNLAKGVEKGTINLNDHFGDEGTIYDKTWTQLTKIKGVGPFSRANILMCIGFYQTIPSDTETIRHIKEHGQVHGRESCNKQTVEKDVEEIYEKYAPYQSLLRSCSKL
ncbi:hypothetical protein K2173_019680 [Erythroxylum novogranatense]|uniref:HhH-GPD domain-containing protein n=1 Tax=Erythroxylum novogranatense TaxID=1862640 RepID=A0AAV8SM08_9ROSI|nr:hypothetical protein K2173_019680 [Erythroxylum novogranatense]